MIGESSHKSFTELEVWKRSSELRKEIFILIKSLPSQERFNLSDQLLRSVRSICANISEGHGRYAYKDQIHFCIQARGSLSETHNHLIDAFECSYINAEQLSHFKEKIAAIERLLNGYISFLRKNLS